MKTQTNPFQPFEYIMRQPLTDADRKLVQDYCAYINANGCRPLYDFEQTLLVRALNEAQAELLTLRAAAEPVAAGEAMKNTLDMSLFRQALDLWLDAVEIQHVTDGLPESEVSYLLAELGTAGMSVVPNDYLLELEARAAASRAAEPVAAGEGALLQEMEDLVENILHPGIDKIGQKYVASKFRRWATQLINQLRATPATPATGEAWVSVKERLPEESASRVIVWLPGCHEGVQATFFAGEPEPEDEDEEATPSFVTAESHNYIPATGKVMWQPLPQAPATQKGGETV